jgi:CheY-like chemotaxis protein
MQSRARIVIVEDNPADALLIVDELRKHSDKYEIEVLRDGAEALRFVRGQGAEPITDVCVLVIDVNLPKYNGIAVLREIRLDPKLANLRVIVLTGVATPGEESAVMDLGVRLYRGKPIHYDGFVQLAGEIAGICDENGSTMTAAG